MKPEAVLFMKKAKALVARAEIMMSVDLREDAARAAYLASFHAAQCYIFERTSRVMKTHKGVQTEFYRISKADPHADLILRRFLSQSYEFKAVADYSTDDNAIMTLEDVREAIKSARQFVSHFTAVAVEEE